MRKIDGEAQSAYRIPGIVLMENAGRKSWEAVRDELRPKGFSRDSTLLFLAGGGNNGGDAMVMLRTAREEGYRNLVLILLKRRLSEAASAQLAIVAALNEEVLCYEEKPDRCRDAIGDADLIIDGLFGAGLTSPLREEVIPLVAAVNESGATVVSVDLPSGLFDSWVEGDPVIGADMTVVTGSYRKAIFSPAGRFYAGTIRRVDPGFPTELIKKYAGSLSLLEREPTLEPFTRSSHKGDRGKCLVVAGAPGTGGAAVLSSRAALLAGAGMVRLRSDSDTCRAVLSYDPSIITSGESDFPSNYELIEWSDTVLIGPGWLNHPLRELEDLIRAVISLGKGLVLDASALTPALLDGNSVLEGGDPSQIVITPHIGEAARLLSLTVSETASNPEEVISRIQQRIPSTVVLKGVTTWVGTEEGIRVLDGSLPVLATAGSGDVLAGIVSAFIARGMRGGDAATEAVLVHHRTGLEMESVLGYGTASDFLSILGRVVRDAEDRDA